MYHEWQVIEHASGNASITFKASKAPISADKYIKVYFQKPSAHF